MISVVICTYNRAHYLGETLAHLLRQIESLYTFEIVLINNNSTDHTEDICKQFSSNNPNFPFKYVVESTQGLSHARNRGIKESTGDVLVFIDDDAFAQSGFVAVLGDYFDSNPETIAVGGKIIPQYEKNPPIWMSKYLLPLVAALDMGNEIKPFRKGKFPIGANMAIRKKAFEKYGVFDTNLGRKGNALEGSEEKDLFLRLTKSGVNIVYLPKAVVHHVIPETRVSLAYIKKQAIGVGVSEHKRLINKPINQKINKFIAELVKIGGTIILSIYFLISFQIEKAMMLIKFRFWVLKGYLK